MIGVNRYMVFNETLDHPVIRNMERTGYPYGEEPAYPRCPVCREECETIYKDKDFSIVGCDNCLRSVDSWEV